MTSFDLIVRDTGRSLVPESLFGRLAAHVARENPHIGRMKAERIIDQALAFVAVAGTHTGEPLMPAKLVDIGWHTFILYTREYAEFCDRVVGQFVHHVPHDDTPGTGATQTHGVTHTLAVIESAGYMTDPDLWTVTAKCNQDCSASGKDGNENTGTQVPPPTH